MRAFHVVFIVVALLASVGCTGVPGKSPLKTFDQSLGSTAALARPQAPLSSSDSNFASGNQRSGATAVSGGAFPADNPPPAGGRSTWDGLTPPEPSTRTAPPLPIAPDPHTRATPTVTGRTLALNPAENGTDRAVELARKIEQLQAENKALQSRIAALEQNATTREEATAESLREVEAATVEVIRSKNELKAYKKAVLVLKDQIRQTEREEVETLKLIVTELEKLLEEPKE
ncbi:hypothetical protein [Limnoglobus roseus]|uniref:Uncharacterized protein n=1 Tax=Limnoglobus roseus TaxID=2598579 RepID=A0A5C1A853_9BACT|nr:hypothetical protein [Limnoglobus roseus]QEL13314.1 hypothetical protein PX52LOC_00168 [Limnoglobus roseus]